MKPPEVALLRRSRDTAAGDGYVGSSTGNSFAVVLGGLMLAAPIVACLTVVATAALAAEPPPFAFKPDEFQKAFNDSAQARKTGRSVGPGKCERGSGVVCTYAFTDVIQARVTADDEGGADEVVVTFVRPTHNIKGHSLISYRFYGDIVHLLSPKADEAKRGKAIRKLLAALHTTDKEVVEVGSVRYTLDMKRTGVRFVAKPFVE
jgi:hypothetical protein